MENINCNLQFNRWKLATLLFSTALLTACGGGGGGGNGAAGGNQTTPTTPTTPGAGAWLELSPSSLNVIAYAGQTQDVMVTAKFSKPLPDEVDFSIADPKGLIDIGQASFTGFPGGINARLRMNAALKAGEYSTQVELRVCEDTASICAKPLPGSPWRVPLTLTVKPASALPPLVGLPQVSAWQTTGGNAGHTAYAPVQLDAAKFGQRFRHIYRGWEMVRGDVEPSHDGGLAFVVSKVTGNTLALQAIDEATGKLAWQKVLSDSDQLSVSQPAVGHGHVYLSGVISGLKAENWFKVFDQKTGEVLATQTNLNVDTDRAPLVTSTAVYLATGRDTLLRLNPDGTLLWRAQPVGMEFYTPVAANLNYVYAARNGKLTIVKAASGETVFEGEMLSGTSTSSSMTTGTPVLDERNVLYMVGESFSNTRLFAYDTVARKLLWEVPGDFSRTLAMTDKVLYVMKETVLEARSKADGKLLWASAPLPFRRPSMKPYYNLLATDNLVFISHSDSNYTYAVDTATQRIVWQYQQGGKVSLSPSGLFFISGRVYLPDDKNYDAAALSAINLH